MGFGGLASLIPWGAAFLVLLAFIRHSAKKQAPGAGPYRQILYGIATVGIVAGWIFMAGKAEPHLAEYQKAEALYHHFRCRNNMDLDRLKQQYEKAIALAPAFEAPYYRMADIAQSMGRSSLALSYYDRLGSRGADPATINVHRALVYERLGDRTTAAALYREAHRLAPDDWQVMLRWADFQWRNRNVSFALQILERAQRLYPENPTIRRALETVNQHRR
jgi:tetratricopeptide (TPR) repeat protein